jgi:hypothetical protein
MTDGTPVRLVWRVADMAIPEWPGLITTTCHRCRYPVYVDTTQLVPPAFTKIIVELVCIPCALNDSQLRPEVEAAHRAVRKLGAAQALAEYESKARWQWQE